ncbi:MAG: hypothetical protein EOO20_16725 [Chryseobacterium sp.]|nr:MAG: hypothetical protein EOO20_16725 [Chryseobacterium sp.]
MENPVPDQHSGSEINAVAKATFENIDSAKAFYALAKKRLLNVSDWAEVSKLPSSTFTLCDRSGNPIKKNAEEGDLIRIDIPGPGTHNGDGYDWVNIELITEEIINGTEQISLRARPCANPNHPSTEPAHFFKTQATSTFQIKRIASEVFAEEHGRNEVQNTKTDHVADNIRNTLVGLSAKIGLSYPQWKGLVEGLVSQIQK